MREEKFKRFEDLIEVGLMVPSIIHDIIHDIRGHISVIKAQAQLGMKEQKNPRFEKILNHIDSIEEIIETFRNFYKYGKVEKREIEISELIDQAISEVSYKISSDIDVIKDVEDFRVYANRIMMRQAISNLLSNAIDAVSKSKQKIVGVLARKINGKATILVFDTGCGIPKKFVPKLFSLPFTTKGESGTGIGLIIAKQMIEANGGKISYVEKPKVLLEKLKLNPIADIDVKTMFEIILRTGV